ncbi:MAG: CRISPR-associated endonuclease Cas3'' [Candidatus Limnocylindrales bacterium]|jgi:CRISPR-associated endonuclease/helicase Cas3
MPGEDRPNLLAHLVLDRATGVWRLQGLLEHLQEAARRAGEFAEPFASADWGRVAGLWHDLGKAQPAWQRYLLANSGYDTTGAGRVPHSMAGAEYAVERLGPAGHVLAYVIGGHHAGLADAGPLSAALQESTLLANALESGSLPTEILDAPAPEIRQVAGSDEGLHLWIRMLYSCLVDADSLDAEHFESPDRSDARVSWPTLEQIESRLTQSVECLPRGGAVNAVRWQVRDEVMPHAGDEPGFFSLTVPTGGGKTLTSLSFALAHARANRMRRIIYAIPYLSIIEQTADIFRKAVGEGVLEHHSNLDTDGQEDRDRLAAENWDAPLIVTTTVQLFESLFASRRGRCRKLHNIAGSVIVLDEAQLLPPDYLEPVLSALWLLVAGYGVSVVLCTATQPALASGARSGRTFKGLDDVRELVLDPDALATRLDRVAVEWPSDPSQRTQWDEVAAWLAGERQALCVVNTRSDAAALSALVPGSVHLSASMCAEHRARKLAAIKERLVAGSEVRVVSTQLIEAGVDIDFPVVFRALTGLDSIAQSAGRCNREGNLSRGRVVVFMPPKPCPIGHLRQGEGATKSLLSTADDASSLLRPDGFRRYFDRLYGDLPSLDAQGILPLLQQDARSLHVDFRSASEKFRMIDNEGTATVLVPFERGAALIAELKRYGPDKTRLRRLQRYSVTLYAREFGRLRAFDGVDEIAPELFAVTPGFYDDDLGVVVDGAWDGAGAVV